MALLNPPDAVPEAMRFLVRAILAHPRDECSREELLALVAPEGLVEAMSSIGTQLNVEDIDEGEDPRTGGRTIAERSLDALLRLGLVVQEDGVLRLGEKMRPLWRTATQVTAPSFARVIRRALFDQADPESIGESGVNDLSFGYALLFSAPSPLEPFDGFDRTAASRRFVEYQRVVCGQDSSAWPIGNNERWGPFRRFVLYLGLAQAVGPFGIVADASVALREGLSGTPMGRTDIGSFVQRCADVLPVSDGGKLHYQPPLRDPAHLSSGLSLTLMQLKAERLIDLTRVGDAATRSVCLGEAPDLQVSFSHVEWLGPRSKS
jgi:hypothetical protein